MEFDFMNCSPRDLGLSASLARRLILASQRTRFRGVGGYSTEAFAARNDARPFPQAEFPDIDLDKSLRGRDVLDFGSGYGGRTVDYARISGAKRVFGVEPIERPIALAKEYAASRGVSNVDFRVCGTTTIPMEQGTVDVVVSYDVLEHVESPPASVGELWRVLRPGGRAYLVFPVYFGARSHHLDYITTLPGLHWLFSATTLVRAVNSILADDETNRFGTTRQPAPSRSFDGRRSVLPQLNGLSGRHLRELFRDFRVIRFHRHVILRSKPVIGSVAAVIATTLSPSRGSDALTDSVAVVLEKPAS